MAFVLAGCWPRLRAVPLGLCSAVVTPAVSVSACHDAVSTSFISRRKSSCRPPLYRANNGSEILVHEYQRLKWFSSCSTAPISSVHADNPPASDQKPEPSPAVLRRLLKISRPGSLREKKENSGSPASEADTAVSAGSGGEQQTPEDSVKSEHKQEDTGQWKGVNGSGEFGFKYKGPEPTLYGDWAHKGRVSDF